MRVGYREIVAVWHSAFDRYQRPELSVAGKVVFYSRYFELDGGTVSRVVRNTIARVLISIQSTKLLKMTTSREISAEKFGGLHKKQ